MGTPICRQDESIRAVGIVYLHYCRDNWCWNGIHVPRLICFGIVLRNLNIMQWGTYDKCTKVKP